MKKILLLIGFFVMILALHFSFAQQQGVISYEVKINMHRRLPPDRQEMKQMVPEFSTSNELLFFNENASLYKPLIEDEPEEFGNGTVQIKMQKPYFEFYSNKETQELITKKEFMGKNYLINDVVKVAPWKFSDEKKVIQGYECKQAYYKNEETNQLITAWYTPSIRPFLGPANYGTLPGAILALDINSEEQVFVATKIEFRELKNNELKIPKGGEVTTEEEFKKMRDEKIKQMGGHGIVIKN